MPPAQGGKPLTYWQGKRLASAKQHEFTLTEKFSEGYRNREDKTKLPPGVLVEGSQNVLTDVSGRIGNRKGYSLDGAADSSISSILSAFDWPTHLGVTRHLRAGFLTSAANDGKLQFRYKDSSGTVTWTDLLTGLTSVKFNFASFWDAVTEKIDLLLMVNGGTNVYEWSGAVGTVASASAATGSVLTVNSVPTAAGGGYTDGDILTITGGDGKATVKVTVVGGVVTAVTLQALGSGYAVGAGLATTGGTGVACTVEILTIGTGFILLQGTKTAAQLGFYTAGTRTVTISGVTYAYTGMVGNYLTGITGDASATPAGTLIFQTIRTTTNASMTSFPSGFNNDLIAALRNQVYIGSLTQASLYVSKVNDYKTYTVTTPTRVVGEGAVITLDAPPTAMIPQEDAMYLSAGKDWWYKTKFTLSADITKEEFTVNKLNTAPQQAAQSQALTWKVKNSVAFISNEPILNTFGPVENVLGIPQMVDISHSIINDMNAYDFTDGSVAFWRNFLLLAVPKHSLIRIYNMTDPKNQYWEAPQTIPISRFSIIDGLLYGHSYNTSESYKLFDGYTDNGNVYSAIALFSFNHYGTRFTTKSYNQFWVEGYISPNTILELHRQYDLDGCAVNTQVNILGSDGRIVCVGASDNSLGTQSLGTYPLGGTALPATTVPLPPWFRVIKTFNRESFFQDQIGFASTGLDQQWSLISFGPAVSPTSEGQNDITE